MFIRNYILAAVYRLHTLHVYISLRGRKIATGMILVWKVSEQLKDMGA